MKNIKEAEAESGINKQNIRYYEKMGLIHPDRNTINGYRKYSEEDIRRLKFIYLFRKLDMPLEEIRSLLDGAVDLQTAIAQQKDRLKAEQERIQGAVLFCEKIQERKLEELDVDNCLQKMEAEEKCGSLFANILYDYKRVIKGESIREISFIPDDFCTTPEQMTEQLLKYADENKLDIVITKESMYPEFTIDGIAYKAYRSVGRFGMRIIAEAVHKEDYIPEHMSEKKYHVLRVLSCGIVWGVIVAGILLLDNRFDLDAIGWEVAVVVILFWVVGVIYMLIYAKKKF